VRLSVGHKIFAAVFATSSAMVLLMVGLAALSLDPDARQFRQLAMSGLLALAVSSLLTAWLADTLRKALRPLVLGTRRLAQGEYTTPVEVASSDELGQLATHLNGLASTLERSDASRKQWIADVSHELRTPLAVLRAEIEALQDGVRPANSEAFELLHGQVMAVTALTDDLFQLARSDLGQMNYRMREVDLWSLLREVTEQFQSRFQRSGLELSLVRESSRLNSSCWGDSDRLRQLLNNFLENSLRYTDPPGRVEVRCQSVGPQWVVRIDDSAPGVAPEMLDRLFDRFFRVEASRSKQLGGCGLGLAICQNIAQAHQGQLRASASPLGGLRLEFILPCYPR
jgi:two-component system sensor histidine kinase BaeS